MTGSWFGLSKRCAGGGYEAQTRPAPSAQEQAGGPLHLVLALLAAASPLGAQIAASPVAGAGDAATQMVAHPSNAQTLLRPGIAPRDE